jgi:hypothetical protein
VCCVQWASSATIAGWISWHGVRMGMHMLLDWGVHHCSTVADVHAAVELQLQC